MKKEIIFALGILVCLLSLTFVNALGTQLVCLRQGETIYFSECNPDIFDYTCDTTKCQLCVNEVSSNVYCPLGINDCNELGECTYLYEEPLPPPADLPVITLINPANGYSITSEDPIQIEFDFKVTKSAEIQKCELIVIENVVATKSAPIGSTTQRLYYNAGPGSYTWKIKCTQKSGYGGNVIFSDSRVFTIVVPSSGGGGGGGGGVAKPKVETFVFSYCPFGLQFEKALFPVYDLLKNKANISIVFIGAMHGEFEHIESLRQICIEKNYGKDKLFSYLKIFDLSSEIGSCLGTDTCVNPLIENIYTTLSINKTKIANCINNDAEAIYQAQNLRAFNLGIAGSPTFVINGVEVSVNRNPNAIKTAVCNAFTTMPSECNQVLSNTTTSPGFGGGGGTIINETEQESRILSLELWKQTILDTITNLIATITGHTAKLDNHEARISALENKTSVIPNGTLLNYLKYLSASNRKAMVCGYAEENKLTSIIDLGYNCIITYRTSYLGRVSSSCRCSKI